MKHIRIAFLDEGRIIGGAEKNLLALAKYLVNDNYDLKVFLCEKKNFYQILKEAKLKIEFIKGPRFLPISFQYYRLRLLNPIAILYDFFIVIIKAVRAKKYLSANKISVIQTNGLFEHLYGGFAGRLCGIAVVWFMQDIPKGTFRTIKKAALNLLAAVLPTHIVAASSAVESTFLKTLRKKVSVIHNSIEIECYLDASDQASKQLRAQWGAEDEDLVIAMMGRLVHWKGHLDFIQASKIVHDAFARTKFILIGGPLLSEDPYICRLKTLIKKLGLEDSFVFTGFLKNVVSALGAVDVFVQCSLYPDPCPIAVMEAAALKKPIVATCIGGIPEIIQNEKEGILVKPGNYKALSRGIMRFVDSPQRRQLYGQQAYARIVKDFTIQRQAQLFKKLYEKVKAR